MVPGLVFHWNLFCESLSQRNPVSKVDLPQLCFWFALALWLWGCLTVSMPFLASLDVKCFALMNRVDVSDCCILKIHCSLHDGWSSQVTVMLWCLSFLKTPTGGLLGLPCLFWAFVTCNTAAQRSRMSDPRNLPCYWTLTQPSAFGLFLGSSSLCTLSVNTLRDY